MPSSSSMSRRCDGAEPRRVVLRALDLAARPREGVPADVDGRRAAVVADRHPLVVGQQRVVGPELLAHRGGVVDADIEVGVVADLAWQPHLRTRHRHQRVAPACLLRAALAQTLGEGAPHLDACRRSQSHQAVHLVRLHQAGAAQVEHLVADGHADAPVEVAGFAKAPERQVLDREVGGRVVGRLDPAGERRIVGLVDANGAHRHFTSSTPRRT